MIRQDKIRYVKSNSSAFYCYTQKQNSMIGMVGRHTLLLSEERETFAGQSQATINPPPSDVAKLMLDTDLLQTVKHFQITFLKIWLHLWEGVCTVTGRPAHYWTQRFWLIGGIL